MPSDKAANGSAVTNASLPTLSIWAKEHLLKGNYDKAEEYYSRAIARVEASASELPSGFLMSLLEGRADAKARNGKLEQALDDGNRMLAVEKTNPMGYYLLGSLLQMKKKPRSALKCYAYGLEQCAHTHPKYKALQEVHMKLTKSLRDMEREKKKRDPMAMFPAEILFMVFSYLSVQDLLRCHRVSRQWRAIAVSDPSLYQYIDLSVATKALTAPNIKALVRYAGGAIKGLKMDSPESRFSTGCFQLITHTHGDTTFKTHRNILLEPLFRQLEELELMDVFLLEGFRPVMISLPSFPSTNLRRLLLGSALSSEDIEYICVAAPLLEHLSCQLYLYERVDDSLRFPFLKTFHIGLRPPRPAALQLVVNWFPNVEDFAFYEQTNYQSSIDEVIYDWEDLKVMTVRQTTAPNLSITSNKLTTLDLAKSGYLTVCNIPAQPNLQHLHIRDLPNLPIHPFLTPLLSSGPTLESLTISSPQFEVRDIENMLREAVNLRSLNIDNLRYTNDATLQLLHAHQCLQVLSVNHCTGITGHGIIQLIGKLRVKKGGKLTAISVRGNESIRRQTIDWALEMGVKVSI